MDDHEEDAIKSAKRSKLENENDHNEIEINTNSQSIASCSRMIENPQVPEDLPDLIPMDTTTKQNKRVKLLENNDNVDATIPSNNVSTPNNEIGNINNITIENIERNRNDNITETAPGTSNQSAPSRNRNNPNKKRNYRARRISTSSSSSSSSLSSNITSDPNVNNLTESSDDNDDSLSTVSFISVPPHHFSDDSSSSILSLNFTDYDDEENCSPDGELHSLQDMLTKPKPKYSMNLAYEIMHRENGLSGKGFGGRRRIKDYSISFPNRISRSRNTIEKMTLLHNMNKHRGCVNSLNFNNSGELLCTGSDDLKICVWNWSANKLIFSFQSGHQSNVFQTKFINNTLTNGLNIISSGRDGEIRQAAIPPSGSRRVKSTILFKHSGAVHKLTLCPTNPYEILTAGEDGHIVRCDLRQKPIDRLTTVKVLKRKVPLYSIAHHPLDPEFCVCGRDQYVRVYDKRNHKNPVYKMSPEHLHDRKAFICHVTCAVYNQTGSEILASYSDEDIFLFNTKCYIPGHFRHRYMGRSNTKTIKGVNFFGPNSEYIISGSDCGHLFFWHKNTETIINWMKADKSGIVNCLEPHPSFPILATSGLDYDAKIWAPINQTYPPPQMEGLEKCARDNIKQAIYTADTEIFDDRTFFFFVRQCMRNRGDAHNTDNPNVPNIQSSSEDDELDSDGNSTTDQMGQLPCRTQ